MKRLLSFITAFSIFASMCAFPVGVLANYEESAAAAENAVINYNRSAELAVSGNKIVEKGTDNMVVLRGVNVPSLGWGMAEHIYESMTEVYDSWQANIIRLPIQPKYWFDTLTDAERKNGVITGEEYQAYIDGVVKAAQARGKYVILDCHTYVMPLQESLDLWNVLSVKYKNNNAVLFGLLNEPHDIKPTGVDAERSAWDVWRNGGQVTINSQEVTGIGHQQLLDAIRANGANNICIAGGLNWAFDISGLADGYDGLPNGYRLTDTASGNGVMYDSHAYPVKGARNSWNKTIGPVRRVAPVLIGEWGWDSSDNAISGGDCTSNIWMNQLMNWMDDTYGDYDGVPVNWTGWNLHMSSSPRMIDSWDFKTTAFNGTYIKERLLSYGNDPQKFDGVYRADFDTDDEFRSYTPQSGKSAITYSSENDNVVVYHQPTTWNAKLDFPYDWDLNGIQTITMDISADISETVNVGLYGADMEAWTVPVAVDNTVKTVTISVDQLKKQGNPLTDGILDGGLSGIYFGATSTAKGNITVDNIKIVKLQQPVYTANAYPHQDTGAFSYIDIDNTNFPSRRIDNGPGSGSYFTETDETVEGIDGNDTLAKYITYNRINGPWGGCAQFNLANVPSKDTRYFTVCLKGSGVAQTLGVSIGDLGTFSVSFAEGDTDWHQYIYCLDGKIQYPEDIKYVKFTASLKMESYFYADNFRFSAEKPERIVPEAERTFIYDFATYNRNTGKYEAVIKTEQGSSGDAITAQKVAGGLDNETKALEVTYTRSGDAASKALIVYSSSDFFKGNAGDDARTANRKTLKNDMEYMTDLVFYGKSSSGKDEKINIGVIDAANSMSTYTDTKEITLTSEWQQFRIPFDEFYVLDGGMPLECGRVRGFVFSSASDSGQGSFMIDNITHTNAEVSDEPEPVATTEPTPAPTLTVITTAEELLALTASDNNIKLGANIDVGESIVKTKCDTVLDLNGYTITGSGNGVIDTTNNIVILDSSQAQTGAVRNTSTGTSSYSIKASKDITIEGGSFSGGQGVLASNSKEKYTFTVNGGNFSAVNGAGYALIASNHDLIINDCTAEHMSASSGGVMKMVGTSQVVVNSGTYTSSGYVLNNAADNGKLTINGGTFTNSSSGKGVLYETAGGDIEVNGGTIINNASSNPVALSVYKNGTGNVEFKNGQIVGSFVLDKDSTSAVTVSGGTYSMNPENYLAEGAGVELSDGWYLVNGGYDGPIQTPAPTAVPTTAPTAEPTSVPTATPTMSPTSVPTSTPTPSVGGEEPEGEFTVVTTAEEFLALTSSDKKVKLGADIDLGTSAFKTKTAMYLDLNGHTLTSQTSSVIEIAHNFTLVDTASEKGTLINTNTANSYALKCASKNLTVNINGAQVNAASQAVLLNGTGSVMNIKDAVINGGAYAINVANGTLNVESAAINTNTEYSGYALYASGGEVNIEDGTYNYNGTVSSVVISGGANVTINGGTFTNPNRGRGAINNAKGYTGVLRINGGTFENTGGGYSILDSDEATTETAPVINITGGIFRSPFGASKPANTTTQITVTGGTFSADPSAYVDEENYTVVDNGNDSYTVVEGKEEKPDKYSYAIEKFDSSGISVNVTIPENANISDRMYVAVYNSMGRLITVYTTDTIRETNNFDTPDGADSIRVFIWNENMKPLV